MSSFTGPSEAKIEAAIQIRIALSELEVVRYNVDVEAINDATAAPGE